MSHTETHTEPDTEPDTETDTEPDTEIRHAAPDAYVAWHSPDGQRGLHGPYYRDTAHTLKDFAPGTAQVIVGTDAATDRFRFAELVLNYQAPKIHSYWTALAAGGIGHQGTRSLDATRTALAHVIDELLEHHGPVLDLPVLVDALVDAGFTKD